MTRTSLVLRHVPLALCAVLLPAPGALAAASHPVPHDGLRREVEEARTLGPGAFDALDALVTRWSGKPAPRTARPGVARAVSSLGQEGVLPVLDLLVLHPERLHALPPSSREMVTVAMLEGLRAWKDPRAAPALEAVVEGPEENGAIVVAAAQALGALCRDGDVAFLRGHAVKEGRRQRAALSGLGWCRRGESAEVLLGVLEGGRDPEVVSASAAALGWLASAWAWAAMGPERRAEGEALRDVVSDRLVNAWHDHPGKARKALGHAILMVEHPGAAAGLDAGTDAETVALGRRVGKVLHRARMVPGQR
jgi:hypothetical protein